MTTVLGPQWPPIIGRIPPHMAAEDYDIYVNWWPLYAARAKRVWYDVRLGAGSIAALPPNPEPNYERAWIMNTQKRVDMLADMQSSLWLIELRHAATSNAIGRLLQYKLLWLDDPVIDLPLQLYLVTNHYDADLETLAKSQGILYESI